MVFDNPTRITLYDREDAGNWHSGIPMYDWLYANCSGEWNYYGPEIHFELESDAVAFKLMW